jgi:hypothetical protein
MVKSPDAAAFYYQKKRQCRGVLEAEGSSFFSGGGRGQISCR